MANEWKNLYKKYKAKAKEYYKKTRKVEKDLWKHVKAVKKFPKCLMKEAKLKKKYKYLIRLGCILHDIGKTDEVINWYEEGTNKFYSKKNHHKIGMDYLKESEFFDKSDFSEKDKRIILRIVKYHKGDLILDKATKDLKKHKDLICFAIYVVRIADKLANRKI